MCLVSEKTQIQNLFRILSLNAFMLHFKVCIYFKIVVFKAFLYSLMTVELFQVASSSIMNPRYFLSQDVAHLVFECNGVMLFKSNMQFVTTQLLHSLDASIANMQQES